MSRCFIAMTSSSKNEKHDTGRFDPRDRLILTLYAELKAERQTREALEEAIRNGAVSPAVLSAIASDPVPVITDRDVADLEAFIDDDDEGRQPSATINRRG